MDHLLCGCVVSRIAWHEILAWCRLTIAPPEGNTCFYEWWSQSIVALPPSLRKGAASLIALSAWTIWKHRNACIFDNASPSHARMADQIKEDARTWAKAGAKGLDLILPTP